MLPEGIDQNTPWSTFLMDANWVTVGDPKAEAVACTGPAAAAGQERFVDVDAWVSRWATQRYGGGAGETAAQEAWALLASTVYGAVQGRGTDAEDQADGLTSYPVGAVQEHVAPKPDWYDTRAVYRAWELLVQVATEKQQQQQPSRGAKAKPPADAADAADAAGAAAAAVAPRPLTASLRYDIVNTGREVLAKISNKLFNVTSAAKTTHALASLPPPTFHPVSAVRAPTSPGGHAPSWWLVMLLGAGCSPPRALLCVVPVCRLRPWARCWRCWPTPMHCSVPTAGFPWLSGSQAELLAQSRVTRSWSISKFCLPTCDSRRPTSSN